MTQLLPITAADTAGKKHTGQPDPPAAGTAAEITLAVQQLMDAIPNLHEEKINAIIAAYNADGAMAQAHIDSTANPHAVTAAQVGAYTAAQTDAQIDAKVVEIASADMTKAEYAGSGYGIVAQADLAAHAANAATAAAADDGIKIYTHTKTGTVHAITHADGAAPPNGRMLVTASFAAGDTFTVNGADITAVTGADSALTEDNLGAWVSFIFDGTQLNFKTGGLSAADKALLIPTNIREGVTINKVAGAYAGATNYLGLSTLYYDCDGTNPTVRTHSYTVPQNATKGFFIAIYADEIGGGHPAQNFGVSGTGIASVTVIGSPQIYPNASWNTPTIAAFIVYGTFNPGGTITTTVTHKWGRSMVSLMRFMLVE